MASKEDVYLDANWLLGEDSTPRSAWLSLWSGTVFCLFVACVAVWSWPYASRWYLQRQYTSNLRNASTSLEAIESLTALSKLLPESSQDIVEGLSYPDEETHLFAHKLLDRFLDSAIARSTSEDKVAVQTILIALDRAKSKCSPGGWSMVRLLVERIYDFSSPLEDPISDWTAIRAESMLAAMSQQGDHQLYAETGTTEQVATREAKQEWAQPTELDPPSLSQSGTRMSLSDTETISPAPLVEPGPNNMRSISMRIRSDDAPHDLSTTREDTPPLNDATVHVEKPRIVENRPSLSKTNSRVVRGSASTLIQAIDAESESKPEPLRETGLARQKSIDASSSLEEESKKEIASAIEGLESLQDGEVVRLLTSVQSKIVDAAFVELQKRKWEKDHLELAVALAQGDTSERLKLMERLVRSARVSPIPWLVWMAKDGDREVRQRAIALLSAMSDQNALTQLRLLLDREDDKQIRDEIQHVLLSVGSDLGRRASLR